MTSENKSCNENKKFCKHCGNALSPECKFCFKCGTEINQLFETSQNISPQPNYSNNETQKSKMHPVNKATLALLVFSFIGFFIVPFISFLIPISIIAILLPRLLSLLAIAAVIVLTIVPRRFNGDNEHGGLNILSFLFPLIGLIFYFVWHEKKTNKIKGIIRCAITGMLFNIILLFIILIVNIY